MPPRTVKRGAAAAAAKRGGRVTRGTPKAAQNQQHQEAPEEVVKHEEKTAVEDEVKVEEKSVVEEKPVVEDKQVGIDVNQLTFDMNQVASEAEVETNLVANGSAALKSKRFFFGFLSTSKFG